MDKLYLEIFEPAFGEVRLDEGDYFSEHLISMASLRANTCYTDYRALPRILRSDLGGGNMELVLDARNQRPEVLSLILE